MAGEEGQFHEPQQIRQGEQSQKFIIVSAKDIDSLGSVSWKSYLNKEQLVSAWAPPDGSPYQRYQKTKTIEAIDQIGSAIKPRYSKGEIASEKGVKNLIETGNIGRDTAVILDSGGAHSVAMAVKLAEKGYQPVIMFDSIPHPEGINKSEQELATLLYFAEHIKQLKTQGVIKPDAPPVFVLDAHRNDKGIFGNEQDNSYTYTNDNFPTTQELRQQGITKIVYLNEGNQEGRINAGFQSIDRVITDLKPLVREWESGGIKLLYTGIDPWK